MIDESIFERKLDDDIALIRKITGAYKEDDYIEAEHILHNLREQRDAIIEEIHRDYDGYIQCLELLLQYQENESEETEKKFLMTLCLQIIEKMHD